MQSYWLGLTSGAGVVLIVAALAAHFAGFHRTSLLTALAAVAVSTVGAEIAKRDA